MPPPPATVGAAAIVVLVVYLPVSSNGPPPSDFGATIDAFDESTNLLVDDIFVTASPDGGQTDSGNFDGWVDTTSNAETITAYGTITPSGPDPNQVTAVFDKWVNLQPTSTKGIIIAGADLDLKVSEKTNVYALAFYKTPPPPGFFIRNPWTGLVIDIAEARLQAGEKPPARTPLDAFTQKTEGNSNQLWTFVAASVKGWEFVYFLQNPWTGLVIEINLAGVPVIGPIPAGTPLDANTMNAPSGLDVGAPAKANQLWGFVPDPDGSGNYFISNFISPFVGNSFVIDIAEGGSGEKPPAGRLLDAHPQKTSAQGNLNQLWRFVDSSGNAVTVPPPTRPSPIITQPPPPYDKLLANHPMPHRMARDPSRPQLFWRLRSNMMRRTATGKAKRSR